MGICLPSKGYHLSPSLAKFPKPRLPPRLEGLYPSRPRGRLLCNVMCGWPKGSHPTNLPSFRMILAFFLVFCTCGVCERNPRGRTTQDWRPYSWHVSLTGNWALASITWMGLECIFIPRFQHMGSYFMRVRNWGSALWLGICVKKLCRHFVLCLKITMQL